MLDNTFMTEKEGSTVNDLRKTVERTNYRLRTALKHLNMSTFDYDIKADIVYVRKEFILLPDFTTHWFKDGGDYYYLENVSEMFNKIVRESFIKNIEGEMERVRTNTSGELITVDAPIVYKEGNTRWTQFIFDTLLDENGEPAQAIGYCKDIHQEKKELYRLRNIAQTDALTGFRNKVFGKHKIETRISEGKDRTYFLSIIDLDKFKSANDLYGHTFGDLVLKEFSDRIREYLDHETICCRIGGDEFLFFRVCENRDEAMKKLSELKQHAQKTVSSAGASFDVRCSVGFAMYPEHGTTYDDLYVKADMAMYHAKQNGSNTPVMYNDTIKSIQV